MAYIVQIISVTSQHNEYNEIPYFSKMGLDLKGLNLISERNLTILLFPNVGKPKCMVSKCESYSLSDVK